MKECNTPSTQRFTAAASLAIIGAKIKEMDLFGPIGDQVVIQQKTVKYSPTQKLYQAFISLLAGAHGLVEINTRLREDEGLQLAFDSHGCAEQSVVQQTLDAATETTLIQMQEALKQIYREHSRGFRHDFEANELVLDVDLSGWPCGKKAAFASKGYFAGKRNVVGRQLGRVLASDYDEIVLDRLFEGSIQLVSVLQPLMQQAQDVLGLDEQKRARSIVRIDAGAGSLADHNWLLAQGYLIHGKDYSDDRSYRLAQSVQEWFEDEKDPERQIGWVTEPARDYVRPVRRLAVRTCFKRGPAKGQWKADVLISAVPPEVVLRKCGLSKSLLSDSAALARAYVQFYDERGGGVETSFKEDKTGLGMTTRNKARFEGQQMVMWLGTLAHNVLVWAKEWLSPPNGPLQHYGIKRLVRDVFHIRGQLFLSPDGHLQKVVLNEDSSLARCLLQGFAALMSPFHILVILDKT